jgi:ribosomal protein L21
MLEKADLLFKSDKIAKTLSDEKVVDYNKDNVRYASVAADEAKQLKVKEGEYFNYEAYKQDDETPYTLILFTDKDKNVEVAALKSKEEVQKLLSEAAKDGKHANVCEDKPKKKTEQHYSIPQAKVTDESETEYVYDEKGNLIKEITNTTLKWGDAVEETAETIYEYDDQDRLVHKTDGSELEQKITYEGDTSKCPEDILSNLSSMDEILVEGFEDGTCAVSATEEYYLNNESQAKKNRYEYKYVYDSHGHIIEEYMNTGFCCGFVAYSKE